MALDLETQGSKKYEWQAFSLDLLSIMLRFVIKFNIGNKPRLDNC